MHDVLLVQVAKRIRDLADQETRLLVRQRQIVDQAIQRLARNAFQHDIGLARKIADAETVRHMRCILPRLA